MKKMIAAVVFLLVVSVQSEAQFTGESITKKFDEYTAIWPKTKLQLIFNQNKYSPGDTIYFKIYFLKEDLQSIPGNQVIEVNLVDPHGVSKSHVIVRVKDGVGQNQIIIPGNLSGGIYLITAHSNWMKNFDPELIFKREMVIVSKNSFSKITAPIKVIAEGGYVIQDIPTNIIIETGKAGSGVELIDQTGKEIGRSTADMNGFAAIRFTPAKDNDYFTRIVGDTLRTKLPQTEDDGCALTLIPPSRSADAKLKIAMPVHSNFRKEELMVILTAQGKVRYTTSFVQGTQDVIELDLPREKLPQGVTHVSILSRSGDVLAYRDFFWESTDDVRVSVETSQSNYHIREKVKLQVSITDASGNPLTGEFSFSVTNGNLFAGKKQNSLADELTILTETKEKILIDRMNESASASLDLFLISQTEPLPWKNILAREVTQPRFPFISVIQKNGKAYSTTTGKPVPDGTQIIFYFQRSKKFYQTFAMDQGKVMLNVPPITDDELLYLGETFYQLGNMRHGQEVSDLKIDWTDDAFELPAAPGYRGIGNQDPYASFTSKKILIDKSFGVYSTTSQRVDSSTTSPNKYFEAMADVTVNLSDYFLFPAMEDFIKEVIPSLFHRKSGGKSIVRVNLPEPLISRATGDPLYIIDGIANKNTDYFLSLKPADVVTLSVVKDWTKLSKFGLMGKNGFVVVSTKQGDMRQPLADSTLLIKGIQMPLRFNAPDYTHPGDLRKPDFRSTIFWNPSIETDATGKATIEFYCSDDVGKLDVRIDGMSSNRKPFSKDYQLEVVVDGQVRK